MKKYAIIATIMAISMPSMAFARWYDGMNPLKWFKSNDATEVRQETISDAVKTESVKVVGVPVEKIVEKTVEVDNPKLLSRIAELESENRALKMNITGLTNTIYAQSDTIDRYVQQINYYRLVASAQYQTAALAAPVTPQEMQEESKTYLVERVTTSANPVNGREQKYLNYLEGYYNAGATFSYSIDTKGDTKDSTLYSVTITQSNDVYDSNNKENLINKKGSSDSVTSFGIAIKAMADSADEPAKSKILADYDNLPF